MGIPGFGEYRYSSDVAGTGSNTGIDPNDPNRLEYYAPYLKAVEMFNNPVRYAKCPYCGRRQDTKADGIQCIKCNGNVMDNVK